MSRRSARPSNGWSSAPKPSSSCTPTTCWMPQSGERIRGRDNMQAYKEAYPNPPTIQLRRVVGAGDVWVVKARSDYGDGQTYHVIDIVQYRDNKIWRETRYYAQPFQAPEWRAQWVEPMEQAATPAGPTA